MTIHKVLKRPLVTEKGVDKKDNERTMCFEVAAAAKETTLNALKQQIEAMRQQYEARLKVLEDKLAEVRTANMEGKLRRRGKFAGYRSDWKKAYVKLKAGEKVPEFAEI